MEIIKGHICPTCGGVLDIDLERQMYICSYCGVTFDYEYFREEEMMEHAYKMLKSSQFVAAADEFDFLLTKDPHDISAIKGAVMAAACIPEIRSLSDEKAVITVDPKAGRRACAGFSEGLDNEGKAYLEKFEKLLELILSYQEDDASVKDLTVKRKRDYVHLNRIYKDMYEIEDRTIIAYDPDAVKKYDIEKAKIDKMSDEIRRREDNMEAAIKEMRHLIREL